MATSCDSRYEYEPLPIMTLGKAVGMYFFGRPINWKLASNPAAGKLIAKFAYATHDVTTIFAPHLDFSARICRQEEFNDRSMMHKVSSRHDFVHILRGASGDAVEIKPREAAFFPTGDCPTVVIYHPPTATLMAAHAGRDCLWNRSPLKNRMPDNVIDALLEAFRERGINTFDLKAAIVGCISPSYFSHPFHHPIHGDANKEMVSHFEQSLCTSTFYVRPREEGRIDLKAIIRKQLVMGGVPESAIACDALDTFSDKDQNGDYGWWSNRRGDAERNGVLVLNAPRRL